MNVEGKLKTVLFGGLQPDKLTGNLVDHLQLHGNSTGYLKRKAILSGSEIGYFLPGEQVFHISKVDELVVKRQRRLRYDKMFAFYPCHVTAAI